MPRTTTTEVSPVTFSSAKDALRQKLAHRPEAAGGARELKPIPESVKEIYDQLAEGEYAPIAVVARSNGKEVRARVNAVIARLKVQANREDGMADAVFTSRTPEEGDGFIVFMGRDHQAAVLVLERLAEKS